MNAGVISLIGIFLGLFVLMFLVTKGTKVLLAAPAASLVVLILSGQPLIDGIITTYATSLGNYMKNNMLMFMAGCVFGTMMGECGAAQDIAVHLTGLIDKANVKNKQFLALVVLSMIFMLMNYGGINSSVIIFTMLPFCKRIFNRYNIPWHLYLAIQSLGSLATESMFPGTTALVNVIPMDYLGTTSMAGAKMGSITAVICIAAAVTYIYVSLTRCVKAGEGFMETGAVIYETIQEEDQTMGTKKTGSLAKALFAPIVVLLIFNIFNLNAVVTLAFGTLLVVILYFKEFAHLQKSLNTSATNGARVAANIASIVGFGGVVAASPAYDLVLNGLQSLPGSPLIQLVIAINAVSAITGSASGGISIALETLGDHFLSLGIPPEVIHRVSSIASMGFDSMPHNGSVSNQMEMTKLTYAQGYKHIFIIACLLPFLGGFIAVGLYYMGIV